tara:strand:- start:103 stop:345 length:243 start_codon:yes stop_codon:yes gene_type:complete
LDHIDGRTKGMDMDRDTCTALKDRCRQEELQKKRPFGVKPGKAPRSTWFQHFSSDEVKAADELLQLLKDREDFHTWNSLV